VLRGRLASCFLDAVPDDKLMHFSHYQSVALTFPSMQRWSLVALAI